MRDGGRRGAALVAALLVATAGACTGGAGRRSVVEDLSATPRPAVSLAASTYPAGVPTRGPQGQWRRLADAPTARLEVAAAAADERIVVAGGLVARGVTKVVESYDPAADRWARLEDLPRAVHHASAVVWRDTVIVLGGFRGGPRGVFDNASSMVWALGCPRGFRCPRSGGGWIQIASIPTPRGAAAAAVVGDLLVVTGGQADGEVVGATEIFDLVAKRWRTGAPMPTPRDHLAAASDGVHLYAIGGRRVSIGSVLGAAERYDPAADRWAPLPALPTARGGFAGAFSTWSEGTVVTAGGEGAAGTFDEVEAFSVRGGVWAPFAGLPLARHGLGLVAIGRHVYAIVGGPEVGRSVSTRLEVLALGSMITP